MVLDLQDPMFQLQPQSFQDIVQNIKRGQTVMFQKLDSNSWTVTV
jgi:hypothetical protein